MFAEMLIHFRFGKFLHYPYVLFLGKVMPNFSGDHVHVCVHDVVLKYSLLLYVYRAGNHGRHDERRSSGYIQGRREGRHDYEQQDPDKMSMSKMQTPDLDRP